MNNKLSKADFLYMRLTTWLLQNHREIWDSYEMNHFEKDAQDWREYNEQ